MNYKEAIEYISLTQGLHHKSGLTRMRKLMELIGNPQKGLKYVHVAGTNGKGSIVSMIASILMKAGYKVGVYTSPHINRYNERIRVNDTEISEEDIIEILSIMKESIEQVPYFEEDFLTEFDMVTALAFQYFSKQRCDIIILETGLGGRVDSTNIIDKPEIAVITTINYDHLDILGKSLSEIAFEKAGIIKNECDVVLYPQKQGVQIVFEEVCRQRKARLHEVDFSKLILKIFDHTKQIFDFDDDKELEITLLGEHQIRNAAVAIKAIEILRRKGYDINDNALRLGLKKAEWPGRFEIVNQSPLVVIDGAHNVEGVKSLVHNLQKYFPNKKITFICGVLADKTYMEMIDMLIPLASRFVTVTPDSKRALSAEDLAKYLQSFEFSNVLVGGKIKNAIDLCINTSYCEEVICVFGSLYYIGEVREYFGLNSHKYVNSP